MWAKDKRLLIWQDLKGVAKYQKVLVYQAIVKASFFMNFSLFGIFPMIALQSMYTFVIEQMICKCDSLL